MYRSDLSIRQDPVVWDMGQVNTIGWSIGCEVTKSVEDFRSMGSGETDLDRGTMRHRHAAFGDAEKG